jgi:hypothetical protein
MLKSRLLYLSLLASLVAVPAFAQSTTPINPGTNAADQQQIEQGLQNGSLSSGEASKLEREQQNLDKDESKGDSQTQLDNQQNKFENSVNKLETNTTTGNPNSANDKRMQADVQRNVNQQNRIENGVNSGQVTQGEEDKLERGQAHVNRDEANSHGHMTKARQASIQKKENHQSKHVYRKKHNDNTTTPASSGTTPASSGTTN